jgi:hypothetical protein
MEMKRRVLANFASSEVPKLSKYTWSTYETGRRAVANFCFHGIPESLPRKLSYGSNNESKSINNVQSTSQF